MSHALLDTHIFVWALADPDRVPKSSWEVLRDPQIALHLSVASAWELAIKSGRGKITLPGGVGSFVAEGCRASGVRILPVRLAHLDEVAALPHHHRDPHL